LFDDPGERSEPDDNPDQLAFDDEPTRRLP
jgi:hypothetical protein